MASCLVSKIFKIQKSKEIFGSESIIVLKFKVEVPSWNGWEWLGAGASHLEAETRREKLLLPLVWPWWPGLAMADNAMIVGGGGPRAVVLWSQAVVTAAPQAVVSWRGVQQLWQLRHQAAGWSFLLAGRAICQPRLGSAGRRGSQSPSSHLSPVTRPRTWSDQQSPATYDPSLIQPPGEIIRNTGCRERSSVSPPALSIDQPLANNRSYSDLTAASCWIHRHKAFCYRAK